MDFPTYTSQPQVSGAGLPAAFKRADPTSPAGPAAKPQRSISVAFMPTQPYDAGKLFPMNAITSRNLEAAVQVLFPAAAATTSRLSGAVTHPCHIEQKRKSRDPEAFLYPPPPPHSSHHRRRSMAGSCTTQRTNSLKEMWTAKGALRCQISVLEDQGNGHCLGKQMIGTGIERRDFSSGPPGAVLTGTGTWGNPPEV